MKKIVFALSIVGILAAGSCKKDDKTTDPGVSDDLTLNEDVTKDRTLKSGQTYSLENIVYVKDGATLTIEPGVTIKATKGKHALVITRGSKINATGTADKPIVLTSGESSPAAGDWGGLIVLGKAGTNASFNGQPGVGEIEGGINTSDGLGLYGGSDDDDNSGTIKYMRIEYAGYPFQPGSELNSLTLGGVGRKTDISYVQTSYGFDDAFEMFGGTVKLHHIIAYKTLDDDFDTDNGYRGTVQFAISVKDKNKADVSGGNGFESDNDASGTENMPYTAPVFANVTVVGPKKDASTTIDANFKRAAHLRRNTRTSAINSIFMGFPTGIYLDGSKSANAFIAGDMELRGLIIAGMAKPLDTTGTTGTGLNFATTFATASWNNSILTDNTMTGLNNPYGEGMSFDPTPSASSPAASGAVSGGKLASSGLQGVSYRGAVAPGGSDTWWKNWTRFDY
ncbi:MAG: hypothetical protein BGO69_12880 [Bacteroidetes bacterium 46-16]|nr:MAG: hypothetical protein BGO69_12880 [Bacteroidetes bacterium 46-16]